ncbi:PAS domain S-box protein [Halobaculum saliterrae]
MQYETTRDIAEAETLEEGLRAALRDVCELTDWEYAEVWLPTDDGELRRTDIDYYEDEFAEFSVFSAEHTFGRGEGLPGRVWASGEFEWASDLPGGSFEAYPRRERAADADLRSSLGVPVLADDEVVAVLTFLMGEVRDTDERLVETVSSVAAGLGDLVVRRRAEEERKHEQAVVDQILAVSPIGIQVSNRDGEITRMNDRAREILEVLDSRSGSASAAESPIYDADGERVSPTDLPFSRVLTTGEAVFDAQFRVELPDGGHRWLRLNAAPILDSEGEVERVVTTGEDITQLKEQTRHLERQREELKTELDEVFERISDGFYALDTAFRITYVNDHAETLLGLEESSVVGQDIRETIPLSDRFEAALHRALEEQTPVKSEGYDGSLDAWLESTIYPSESGVSVHFRDITERKERERTLERYESVTETASDGILSIDDQSRIRSVNPAVEEMFGYPPDELLGESLTKLMPERLAVAHDTGIAQYLRTGERTLNWDHVELPGVTADGTEIPLSISFSEYEHDGRHHFAGIVRDISEREERERELQDRIRQQKVVTDLGTRALEGSSLNALMAEATRLVAETLDNDYCKVLDLDTESDELLLRQGVGWDEGTVNEATISAVEDDSQAAYTLATEQPVIVEDLSTESRFSGPDLLRNHDVRSGISTIIGPVDDPWGILGTHDTDVKDFSEHDAAFVQSVANVLAAAIERHDREQEVRHQRDQLAALNSLNRVVQEITNAVIEQSTREEIEAIACERLAESDSYLFAWIGTVETNSQVVRQRAEAGVEGYLDDVVITVDPDDEHSQGPTGRAFRTGEIQVANDVQADSQFEPWRDHAESHGFRSSAAIPIVHEGTVYGVLNVYAERPNAFTGQERVMIGQVGEIIGHAIAAAERKQALMSDTLVELTFQVPDVYSDHDMPVEMAGTVTFDQAVAVGDGEYLIYGTTTPEGLDSLTALVEVRPYWESITVRSDGDPARFELRVTDSSILSAVASHGGYLVRAVIEDGNLRMTIHLPPTVDVRQVIEAVETAYPSAEMVRRKQISRDRDELHHFQRRLMRELTDRQRATLEAAYHAGFFGWPRDTSGEEVAESMGVAPPTFHQHLRKAQGKVFDAIFSSPIERAGERTE